MPRIPDEVLESVFYLYESREEAERGSSFGGSGFFVSVQSDIPDILFSYAVTNWHVAVQGGASVIRVNCIGGGVEIFEFDPAEWHFKPGGYDIAVIPVPLKSGRHAVTVLNESMLIDREKATRLRVGPGDNIFMVGRFVDHDGHETNVPATRFGNISVMPQPIQQTTGSNEPSFILDIHSRSGYSGSPVFAYRTPGSDISRTPPPGIGKYIHPTEFLQLLGIHWGQFPEKWEIERAKGAKKTKRAKKNVEIVLADGVSISGDASYIVGLSGMTMAAPAWAIKELLDMPKLKQERDWNVDRIRSERASSGALPPRAEMATGPGLESDNPSHKEDFTSLLTLAAKTPSQDD